MNKNTTNKTLVVVAGPTASGKTSLAIKLAKSLNTEIVSADSRQFYREIKIGTAAPTKEELQEAKHHLIGNLSIHDYFNVFQFEQEALSCINNIFESNDYAVMVGGSGLYLDAVCNGIDNIPDCPQELRNQLQNDYTTEGLKFILDKLKQLDPEYYEIVDKQNPKRILRALEVCLVSGKTYSSFRQYKPKERPFNIKKIGLLWDRPELVDRIHQRVDMMLEEGLLDEVKSMYPHKNLNSLNTVGYKELFDHFDNKCTFEFAIEKIKTNTRRYAKRQMTWFRKDKKIQWFHPNEYEEIIKFVSSKD
ncbi:MAG: tRNA (adenosine(37)-N6)-dimethylallyltransferase MiaA [Bacteroidales bacterium]